MLFIKQVREKIGVFCGSPGVTPGGRALKFYTSVRIDLRRIEGIKVGNEMIGNRIRARVVKNKVAAPFKTAELEILFDQGISKEGALLDLGVEEGILKKSGSFFSFGQIRLGQGREASRQFLMSNTDTRDEIEQAIRPSVRPPTASEAGWSVGAERTASGQPMIGGDSHRALDVPNVYYQVHLSCPDFTVIGHSVPGVPGAPPLSHN